MRRTLTLCFLTAVLLNGCSLSWLPFWDYAPSAAEQSADLARRAAATPVLNQMGFKVFQGVLAEHPDGNVALSPTSLGRMLLMAYAGARGSTRDAMAKALAMPDQSETTLGNWAVASGPNLDKRGVSISMKDSAWIRANFPVQQGYKDDLSRLFSADVSSFQDAADGTAKLRGWIKAASGGLLDGSSFKLADDIRVALSNVLVFKGKWEHEFEKSQTQSKQFSSVPGLNTPVQMMQRSGDYAYAESEGFQVIRLPYQHNVYAMYVLLPAEIATDSLTLDGDRFERLVSQAAIMPGTILLPRFSFNLTLPLTEELKAVGMALAFSGAADFSGMAPGLRLDTVDQQLSIAVDEAGTVAAAASVGQVGVTSAPSHTFYMEVKRPFYFAIRDDASKAVLFMGRVTNP